MLPVGGGHVDLDEFCRSLVHALLVQGSTVHVTRASAETELGPGAHATSERLAGWLNHLEVEHDYVVYQADADDSEWSRLSVRQADHVLLVANATDDHRRSPLEDHLPSQRADTSTPVDLVLVHDAQVARPTGTNRWLAPRDVTAHHHLRRGDARDYDRIARLVTGRGFGLALGGGGPRGFAHLGAVRALEEAGVPIDYVAGTSIGAVMGGLVAIGLDDATRTAKAIEAFVDSGFLFTPTLPVLSLTSSRKVCRLLAHERFFDDMQVEDTWIPYVCVSASLTRAEPVVHSRGPLATVIRASLSLPGVFPPVFYDGELLVDGGVMNNLPVDVLRTLLDGGHAPRSTSTRRGISTPRPPSHRTSAAGARWHSSSTRCNDEPAASRASCTC